MSKIKQRMSKVKQRETNHHKFKGELKQAPIWKIEPLYERVQAQIWKIAGKPWPNTMKEY